MRIAIDGRYIQDHFPGIGRYTYNLVQALAETGRGDELLLLANPELANSRYDLPALARKQVTIVPSHVPTFSLREQRELPRQARALGVHLLHSTYYIKPYRLPVPSVLTYYDIIGLVHPSSLPSPQARLMFRALSRLALASADRVILLSESARRDIARRFGIPDSRTAVVYPAAGPQFAPQLPEIIKRIRDRYGLPGPYCLYLGINKPHKNLPFLIDAWASAKPPASLVVAGREDPRYPEARQKVRGMGIQDSVRFLGDVPEGDLPALYSGAQLFAYPSLYEGFGLPVLEAMTCGVPVLSSNAASLPEVVGDAGMLLSPTNAAAWSDALAALLTEPARLEEMRAKSLARAAAFSWARAARETLTVYREAVS